MVRLIGGDLGTGSPGRNQVEVPGGFPLVLEKGCEVSAHSALLYDVAAGELREVSRGEWVYVEAGTGGFAQTLPMVREFYCASWLLIPFALVVGFQSIMRAIKR